MHAEIYRYIVLRSTASSATLNSSRVYQRYCRVLQVAVSVKSQTQLAPLIRHLYVFSTASKLNFVKLPQSEVSLRFYSTYSLLNNSELTESSGKLDPFDRHNRQPTIDDNI